MQSSLQDLIQLDLARPGKFMVLRDDFITGVAGTDGSIGELGWRLSALNSGSITTNGIAASALPNPGQVQLITNSTVPTSGNVVGIRHGLATGGIGSLYSTAVFEMNWIMQLPTTTTVSAYVGLINDDTVFPDGTSNQKMIALRYDTLLGDTQWNLTVENAAVSSAAFTGSIDAAFHNFRVWGNGSGTIFASMDGATAISLSSNVPIQPMQIQALIATRAAATRSILIDFFGLHVRTSR